MRISLAASLCAVWLCAVAATAGAQVDKSTPKPADFDMQIPLHVSGQNGVARFTLPLAVYRHAQLASLADVRVFDSAGVPAPFTLTEFNTNASTEWHETEAKIFLVHAEPEAAQSDLELDVRAARDGTVLSVHAKQKGKNASANLRALVLDIGKAQDQATLDSLQFMLPKNVAVYRAELAIEQSDDLKSWDRVAQSHVDWLADANQSAQLTNDRIELAPHRGRYLRVRWIDGTPLAFASVQARWKTTRGPADDSLQVEFQGKPGRTQGDFVYATSPSLLASEVGLNLPAANTVLRASIGYYQQLPPPKRDRYFVAIAQGTFYRLTQNGAERTSSRIHIYPHSLSEWTVHTTTTAATAEAAPTLVLRLRPKTIVFTARGNPANSQDYRLAFGASDAQVRTWTTSETSMDQVAPGFTQSELEQLEQATLGEAKPTRKTDAPTTSEARQGDSRTLRTFVLWSVLLFGVLLLAGMSWRLFKSMQSTTAEKKSRTKGY